MLIQPKQFGTLEPMVDHIYWVDPHTQRIRSSLVISVIAAPPPHKACVIVEYLKDTADLNIPTESIKTALQSATNLTKTLICPFKESRVITLSIIPTIVFTEKEKLELWMAGKQ